MKDDKYIKLKDYANNPEYYENYILIDNDGDIITSLVFSDLFSLDVNFTGNNSEYVDQNSVLLRIINCGVCNIIPNEPDTLDHIDDSYEFILIPKLNFRTVLNRYYYGVTNASENSGAN